MRYRINVNRLSELLAESRVSQNHWALRLGFSRGHWSDLVNGKHPYPSTKTREALLELFGARAHDLFVPEAGSGASEGDFRIAVSGHLGVVVIVARLHFIQLRDQVPGTGVLHVLSLIHI